MLEQLESILVIRASGSQSSRVNIFAKHVLTIGDKEVLDDTVSVALPSSRLSTDPRNPAYVIFTSASRGRSPI